MKVMRLDWVTEENDLRFWELISNARDDVQFVILDKTSQSVIFKLGIEPTSLVQRDLPGNIQITNRNEPAKKVSIVSQIEGDDSVSVSISMDSEDERSLFLQQNCSFSTIVVKLQTKGYGVRSVSSESESDLNHREMMLNFISTIFDGHTSCELTPKFVSRCIYESGEFCTFQHYYILETEEFDMSKCTPLSPGTFHLETKKGQSFDKLLQDELFVVMKIRDIPDFCRNSGGLLVSPNLTVCLQHILRNLKEQLVSESNSNHLLQL
jgi:hypothetical protein